MMPMLRTLVRSVRTSSATVLFSSRVEGDDLGCEQSSVPEGRPLTQARMVRPIRAGEPTRIGAVLPAVVRKGLVRLGHLVRVFATLHSGTKAVARIEDLVHQALGHRLLAPLA